MKEWKGNSNSTRAAIATKKPGMYSRKVINGILQFIGYEY